MKANTLSTEDSLSGERKSPDVGGFRPDVEGMRAIAVLLVMAFHAGLPFVTGGFIGVDVFFVISGFLITGLLLKEVEQTGRVDYRRFYARRIKRLLPASTVVLVAIALASWLWQPDGLWPDVSGEIKAATLFVANWEFAAKATDYFAANSAESPVQHFWSLSVEEQFYLFWPTLLVVFAGFRLFKSLEVRHRLLVGMIGVFVPSLAYSWYLAGVEASRAYFVTTTRVWELALGGIVVLTMPRWRKLPSEFLRLLAWAGLSMVIVAGIWYTIETPFPGLMALLPTVGAALLVGAPTNGPGTATELLSWRPLVWIGGLSYSLYLWHWPLAVLAPFVFPDAGTWVVTVAVAVSVLPAWMSYRWIERPIHTSRSLADSPGWTMALGLSCVVVSLLAASLLQNAASTSRMTASSDSGGKTQDETARGAAALLGPRRNREVAPAESSMPIVPDPAWATADVGRPSPGQCQGGANSSDPRICSAGNPDNSVRLVLIGDSHAMHWFPALESSALDGSFYLQMIGKSGCPWTDDTLWYHKEKRVFTDCAEWRDNVRAFLADDPPEVVVASALDGFRVVRDGEPISREESSQPIAEGMARLYDELARAGVAVIHIADTPSMIMPRTPPECVMNHREDLTSCVVAEEDAIHSWGHSHLLPSLVADEVRVLSMTDGFCISGQCPSVIGNVVAYRDPSHMTGTYSRTLAPYLLRRVKAAAPQVFERSDEME